MASRAATPLRIASRQLRLFLRPSRTLVTASRAKQPRFTNTTARSATTSSAAKTAPSTSASRAAKPAATTPNSASSATDTATAAAPEPSTSAEKHPSSSRTPIPAVSGHPLPDAPPTPLDSSSGTPVDWTSSYHGLGSSQFGAEAVAILQAPLDPDDIEVKPDGIIYLPEIKYRRVLNAAFGPGGWGLAPRGELVVRDRMVSRDYALVVQGKFVGQARGEMQFFSEDGISTAAEGCKSNALMRCCKDLGIASELWDPRFIRKFMRQYAQQVWVEHVTTRKKKQIWLRKDDEVRYPFKRV